MNDKPCSTRTVVFRRASVERHLRRHHPRCPSEHFEQLVSKVTGREWRGVSIGKAVGVVVSNHVRHQLTDYERLLRFGLTREEARLVVSREVQEILADWRAGRAG
jgi:hypothetical protein